MAEKISVKGTPSKRQHFLEKYKERCPIDVMSERYLNWPCRAEVISTWVFLDNIAIKKSMVNMPNQKVVK